MTVRFAGLVIVLCVGAACSNDESKVTADCKAGIDGAKVVARRGSKMKEVSVVDGWATTHRKIEAAMGAPFQHQFADMDAPLCVYIVQGERDGGPSTAAVWLSRDHFDGARNATAQYAEGDAPPEWVDLLPRP